jgi:hypothetical protein
MSGFTIAGYLALAWLLNRQLGTAAREALPD